MPGPKPVDLPSLPPHAVDPVEAARFLREQPPLPVPRRSPDPYLPGLVAFSLLGGKVIRPGHYEV